MESLLSRSLILTSKTLNQRSQRSIFGASRNFFTNKSIQSGQQELVSKKDGTASSVAPSVAYWNNQANHTIRTYALPCSSLGMLHRDHQQRYFSTTVSESQDTTSTTTTVTLEPPPPQKPSVLSLLPPDHTAGQALRQIQIHYSNGRKIRVSDVYSILASCQPYSYKDARIANTLIVDLRRLNKFIANSDLSAVALRTMRRSWLEDEAGVVDDGDTASLERRSGGVRRVQAGVWIGERFLDVQTGFSTAVETNVVEEVVFDLLLVGLRELPDGYVFEEDDDGANDVVEETTTEPADTDDIDNDDDDENKTRFVVNIGDVYTTTKNIINALIRRASNPTRDMKKRAKRTYLKRLRCCQGPTARTIDTAVKICLYGDREEGIRMARDILDSYAEREFLGTADETTVRIVEEAEERLAAKKVEEEEAAGGLEEDVGEDAGDEETK